MADEAGPAPATGSADDASAASSGDGAARPADPPPLPAKANDLEALRKAVEDAANASGNLWLSYLFTLFYLLIAAGAVTHQDLFFEKPVKLPFLSVDLPLRAFFALGPPIFLVLHAYVLLHFVVLAGKIGAFDDALRDQVADEERVAACAGSCRAASSCSSSPARGRCDAASPASCCRWSPGSAW